MFSLLQERWEQRRLAHAPAPHHGLKATLGISYGFMGWGGGGAGLPGCVFLCREYETSLYGVRDVAALVKF